MKKITYILLIIIFSFLSDSSHSQNLCFGFKSGINLSSANISPNVSTSNRTGIIFGAVLEYKAADMFYIQPELEYIMKGVKQKIDLYNYEETVKLDYIQIPVYAKLKFDIPNSPFKPYAMLGPSLGFNINSKDEVSLNGQSSTSDLSSSTETIDFGLNFGAGGEFKITPSSSIFGEIQYGLGLTDISKSSASDWKNTGVKFHIGVKFCL